MSTYPNEGEFYEMHTKAFPDMDIDTRLRNINGFQSLVRAAADHAVKDAMDVIQLILPLAKGYAAAHPVGANQDYVNHAQAWLEGRG